MTTIWTPERQTVAKRLFDAGSSGSMSANELSRMFGFRISRSAVISLWHRRGWSGGEKRQPKNRATGQKRAEYDNAKRERYMVIKANSVGALRVVKTVDAPLAPVKVADVVSLHIGLQDLTQTTCRYPYGDGPFTFCGCEVVTGPYCVPHAALCFNENQGEKRAESEKRKREYLRSQRAA